MTDKYIKETVRSLKRTGWEVRLAKSGHYKCTSPRGFKMTMAATPSDYRAPMKIQRDIRRIMAVEGSTV